MKNNEGLGLVFAAWIFALIALFVIKWKYDDLREDAVKKGYAEWVVTPSGAATWKWKEVSK